MHRKDEVRHISALAARVERVVIGVALGAALFAVYCLLTVIMGRGEILYYCLLKFAVSIVCVQGARVGWVQCILPWRRRGKAEQRVLSLTHKTQSEPTLSEELHVEKITELRTIGSYSAAVRQAITAHSEYPLSLPVMVLLCKCANDEASSLHKGPEQEKALRTGCECAAKLIKHHPSEAAGWKWWAVLEGRLSSYKPTKEKIASAIDIKTYALKAIELDPTDPVQLHVVGAWCHGVAKISWIERKAAEAIFGTPPTSTVEEALTYLERADAIEGFTENSMLMGDCLKELGKPEEADQYYKAALQQIQGPKDAESVRKKIVKRMTKRP